MSKRFIDTCLFDDPWFMDLSKDGKIFFIYYITKCDHAGILTLNEKLCKFHTGIKDIDSIVKEFGNRIQSVNSHYLFMRKFVEFQYPRGLSDTVSAQRGVIAILNKFGLWDSENLRVMEQLGNSYLTVQDKDKDIDKDKVKDKNNDIINKFNSVLDENRRFYIEKYPGRDHDLEFALMAEWIKSNPTKANKKKNWHLFVQSWLNRAKIDYVKAKEAINNKSYSVMDVGNSSAAEDEYFRKMREGEK